MEQERVARLGPTQLTPEIRRLGELLAAGVTDKVIAAREGVTARTVRERFRSLRDSLGATTRFQAGFLFAEYVRSAPGTGASSSGKQAGERPDSGETMQAPHISGPPLARLGEPPIKE
ncbi:MAG TPA: hypothetical protein VEA19_02550 [Actinomycetota bacterium]|nr:hypothetical protein [Actinomycetota bacterium]